MEKMDLYLVGIGGQGILTIADIVMRAALKKNLRCYYYPTKGMAQRGGFVKAQLRVGKVKGGPEIRLHAADVIISTELSESLKAIDYLKEGGDMLVYGHRWLPTDVMLGTAPYPDKDAVMDKVSAVTENGTYIDPALLQPGMSANIFVLGAAMKYTGLKDLFTKEEIIEAIETRFPKFIEANSKAFEAGYNS